MRICVISDTHARTVDELPGEVLLALAEADLIVHAGDFTHKAVLDGLRAMGEVKAVCGNMDSSELQTMLPPRDVFTVAGKRIGLVHGSGAPWGLSGRVREMFEGADIIVFGHSHSPFKDYVKGSLLFNPGSARDSYGLLTLDKEARAEIRKIIRK